MTTTTTPSAAPLDGYPLSRYDKQSALNARAPFLVISRAGTGGYQA